MGRRSVWMAEWCGRFFKAVASDEWLAGKRREGLWRESAEGAAGGILRLASLAQDDNAKARGKSRFLGPEEKALALGMTTGLD